MHTEGRGRMVPVLLYPMWTEPMEVAQWTGQRSRFGLYAGQTLSSGVRGGACVGSGSVISVTWGSRARTGRLRWTGLTTTSSRDTELGKYMDIYCDRYAACSSIYMGRGPGTREMAQARGWVIWQGATMGGKVQEVILCDKCVEASRRRWRRDRVDALPDQYPIPELVILDPREGSDDGRQG